MLYQSRSAARLPSAAARKTPSGRIQPADAAAAPARVARGPSMADAATVSGEPVATLQNEADDLIWSGFVPGKNEILITAADASVSIWTISEPPEKVSDIAGFDLEWVDKVRFNAQGNRAVFIGPEEISTSQTVYLVDISDGQTEATLLALVGHEDNVRDAAFSADGKYLATVSDDRRAIVWHIPDGAKTVLEGHQSSIGKVLFSADSAEVLTVASSGFSANDGTARLWATDSATWSAR